MQNLAAADRAHIRLSQPQHDHGSSFGGDKLYFEGLRFAVTVCDRATSQDFRSCRRFSKQARTVGDRACLCRIATPVAAQGNTIVGQAGRFVMQRLL